MLAAKKTKELVESPAQRMELFGPSEMPFPEDTSPVADRLETVGDSFLAQWKPNLASVSTHGTFRLELVAESLLISARHQTGTRRTAVRTGHVGIGKSHARSRDLIDVGRWDVPAAVGANVGVAEIVGDNQQDIWTCLALRFTGQAKCDEERDERQNRSRNHSLDPPAYPARITSGSGRGRVRRAASVFSE